jgi:hypothetical protein
VFVAGHSKHNTGEDHGDGDGDGDCDCDNGRNSDSVDNPDKGTL